MVDGALLPNAAVEVPATVRRSINAKPKGGSMVAGGDLDCALSHVDRARRFGDSVLILA